ncbi:MAG: glycosyltransferase family 39 protein [Tannerellaceae bacterium]|jgi:4-amino-4-deoxy-L-arabinose transferase-like glycosyltransferase|nr:glycosyltransferase family 39 protein [Tannerellaceae bacterium]
MRTPFLQYLYLQKPVTTILIICAVSVLPWIGMGDFSTKGEPREAAVAISMLESNDWVLPEVYADEFAYKPPMAHWLMAVFSLPQGYVSEFTSRLPSALAYILLLGTTLFFFGQRVRFQEAFIAVLLLLTCIEIHRAGMTARVDMLLTAFIVTGLYALYKWEDCRELKGLPVVIPLLLGCAVLTKGPVGVILPLFVFGVYLLALKKYRLLVIFKALLYAGVSSLFMPLIWYVAAWKEGGDDFLNVVVAENFGRFFHAENLNTNYDLGHENGVWYNFMTLIAGFIPWAILIVFSLFGLRLHKPAAPLKGLFRKIAAEFRSMEKLKQFSLTALVCILVFYSIPSSKRSVYLMPAYPFIALFLAQYVLYITQYRMKVTRIFAGFLVSLAAVVMAVAGLITAGVIDPVGIAESFTSRAFTLNTVEIITGTFASPDILTAGIGILVLAAICTVLCHMRKKTNLKILYSVIFLTFAIHLLIDGAIMRNIRNQSSSRPFAERVMEEYPLDRNNLYVMNNLREYSNLYGLNFYMRNTFHNFEEEQPGSGYFLVAERDVEKVTGRYKDMYTFTPLTSSEKEVGDLRQKIHLLHFSRHK